MLAKGVRSQIVAGPFRLGQNLRGKWIIEDRTMIEHLMSRSLSGGVIGAVRLSGS